MPRRKKLAAATILIACPLTWIGYQVNWVRERRAVLNAPEKYNVFEGIQTAISRSGEEFIVEPSTDDAPWPLGWLGEKGQFVLGMNASKPAAQISRIRKLFPEAKIELVPEEDIDFESLAQAASARR
ncbi:MAG TPA: hypothetical protein VHD36_16695 [Pirellulales bacterium]|nr:hypothetical protein [Pirellulales bacterium]